jgi:outer membrane protein assembly factor BamB
VIAPTEETALYALDRITGQVVWQGVPGDFAGQGIGAVAGTRDRVYVGFDTGNIVALEAATGREVWRSGAIQLTVKRIMVAGNRLYVTYLGPLSALDLDTGTQLWRTTFGIFDAVVDGDRLYAAGSEGLYMLSVR